MYSFIKKSKNKKTFCGKLILDYSSLDRFLRSHLLRYHVENVSPSYNYNIKSVFVFIFYVRSNSSLIAIHTSRESQLITSGCVLYVENDSTRVRSISECPPCRICIMYATKIRGFCDLCSDIGFSRNYGHINKLLFLRNQIKSVLFRYYWEGSIRSIVFTV